MTLDQPVALGTLIGRGYYRLCRRVVSVPVRVITRVRYFNVPDIGAFDGGLLIASNHQSFFDPVLVGMALAEPICYLARRSLFRVPGLGALLRSIRVHPVARGAGASAGMRTAMELLRRGEALVMFPEGTRSPDGSLGPFKRGVAALAIRCGVPVLPVCVEGAYECWPRTRSLPRPGRVGLAFGDVLRPEGGDARQLTLRLRAEIQKLRALLRERLDVHRDEM